MKASPRKPTVDPYEAPTSALSRNQPLKQRPILGVFAGLVVDFIVALVVSLLLVVCFGGWLVVNHRMDLDQAETIALMALSEPYSAAWTIGQFLMQLAPFLAGYTCMRISKGTNLKYALILAVIMLGMNARNAAGSSIGVTEAVLLSAIGFAAVLLGGKVGLR